MKKVYSIILLTFFFSFILKVNATEEYPENYVVLCSYKSPVECNIDTSTSSVYTTNNIQNPYAVIFYSDGNFYVDFNDTCIDKGELWIEQYSFSYKLHTLNTKATRLYQAHSSKAFSDETIPVIWNNKEDKDNLLNKGVCPPNLYYYNDALLSKESNYVIVFSNDDALPEDQKNVSKWVPTHTALIGEEIMFDVNGSITAYLKDNFSSMTTPGVCPGDEETNNLINLFNFNSSVFNVTKASYADKSAIASFMYKSGSLADVEANIKRYQPGGDCYNRNQSQSYVELAKAASSFIKTGKGFNNKKPSDVASDEVNCDKIIGKGTFAYYLHTTFRFIQFLGPIIVIVLSTIEYIKVAALGDSDILKKTNKRTIIRLIFAGLLFVAPIIITALLNAFNVFGNHCEISLF